VSGGVVRTEDLLDSSGDLWADNSELGCALFFGLVERDHALYLASVIQYANFAASEFCPRSGVADCVLFCVLASPVRLDTGALVTLRLFPCALLVKLL